MVTVKDLRKGFKKQLVLRGVSFALNEGEIVGLVGPSGSGKSVLLKLLGRVISPDSGSISHQPRNGSGDQTSVGFLFQEGALFDSLSVIENVAFPLISTPRYVKCSARPESDIGYDQAMQRSFEILKEVGLSEAFKKMPGQLSGGMRRRVALARALVCHPDLVLLDDPTGGLDPVAASVIMNLIRKLHEHYRPTIVMVSHDIRRLLPSVERVLGLFDGRIHCDEPVGQLCERADPAVLRFLATRFDFSGAALGPS